MRDRMSEFVADVRFKNLAEKKALECAAFVFRKALELPPEGADHMMEELERLIKGNF